MEKGKKDEIDKCETVGPILVILFVLSLIVIPIVFGGMCLAKVSFFHNLSLTIRLSVGISLIALPFLIIGSFILCFKINSSIQQRKNLQEQIEQASGPRHIAKRESEEDQMRNAGFSESEIRKAMARNFFGGNDV
jgi:hypothetical protein